VEFFLSKKTSDLLYKLTVFPDILFYRIDKEVVFDKIVM